MRRWDILTLIWIPSKQKFSACVLGLGQQLTQISCSIIKTKAKLTTFETSSLTVLNIYMLPLFMHIFSFHKWILKINTLIISFKILWMSRLFMTSRIYEKIISKIYWVDKSSISGSYFTPPFAYDVRAFQALKHFFFFAFVFLE